MSNIEFTLKIPSLPYRISWLFAGLIAGYLASLAGIQSVQLILLLAILSGISGNWSS